MTWPRVPSVSELAMSVLVALAVGFLLGRCTGGDAERSQVIIQEKKIPVRVVIPGMEVEKTTTTYVFQAADTVGTSELVRQRDSLRLLLKAKGARLSWGIDTVTPSRDTITIDCDEITRQIKARLAFAARDTTVRYWDTTAIAQAPSRWGLSAGLGAVAMPASNGITTSAGIFLGLTYTFIRF